MTTLLSVRNLTTYFYTFRGVVKAIDDVSFDIKEGETFGLVGETGSGKSVTSLSILRIVPRPGKTLNGSVLFKSEDLMKLSEKEMRKIRGAKIAMIFQDPSSSLNPVFTVGYQISEAIEVHQNLSRKGAWEKTVKMMELVQIPSATERVKNYPHEFSGGMKQRVMIAMSLSCQPSLLIADEPTTGLDVTVQAQILNLIKELKEKVGTSVLLITHDLGIVAQICDSVAVMYAGRIVEKGSIQDIFFHPRHPYTVGLLGAVPSPHLKREKLTSIPGSVPSMIDPPSGCRFHPRCRFAKEICSKISPPLEEKEHGHWVACHFDEEVVAARQEILSQRLGV